MASFAQLNSDNHVINVIKIANDGDILDSNGKESEALGIAKCKSLFGLDTNWKQTWFGDPPKARFRAAVPDGEYIPEHDVYTKRKPYNSWVLNTTTYEWEPPTAEPTRITATPEEWVWDESSTSWVKKIFQNLKHQRMQNLVLIFGTRLPVVGCGHRIEPINKLSTKASTVLVGVL